MPALQSPVTPSPYISPKASDDLLLRRYAQGDLSARDEMATRYMPMARRLAAHHRASSESLRDLEQVAYIGLLKSIDRFEPGRGSFVGYAVPNIRGELKRHFRDLGWAIRPPRDLQELCLKVNSTVEGLSGELGRSPTSKEIAAQAGISQEQVLEAMEAATVYTLDTSLDATPLSEEASRRTVGEMVGAEDPGYSHAEWKTIVAPAFKKLPEREQEIVFLRLAGDLKQREIADRVGLSQMHVSRLLRRALTTISAQAAA